MLKVIVLTITVLIATLLIYTATQPDAFRVQRTVSINASPDKVFGLINDFHTWASWSPWEKKDLAMKKTHSGAPQGKGAVLEWDGNKDVGTGRMEVLEAVPASKIVIQLDFFKPFEAHNTAEFTLTPNAGTTQVTWAMYGPQPFMMKVMDIVMNMDKMVGKDFEDGLANLKAIAEK
jgi:uncharacterized protein YndB with AHSA1/START domain